MKQVIIGNDHGGLTIKKKVVEYLRKKGFELVNKGVDSEDSVDYPDIAEQTCRAFLNGKFAFGVLICGTGIGISIAANKIKGIRCALPQNSFAAAMAKEHNNANFIALGGRVDYKDSIEEILDAYIEAVFAGDRHQRRLDKISALE